jgi:hypothetical protein
MKTDKLILISDLCKHYKLENSFFEQVEYYELLEFQIVSEEKYLKKKQLKNLDKIVHLHQDLEINMEGIDVIFNLMNKIKNLENELNETRSELGLYL